MILAALIFMFLSHSTDKAVGQNKLSCQVKREETIAFTDSQNKKDKLIVAVVGGTCDQATYTIEIKNQHGKTVYLYKSDFKPHVGTPSEDPQVVESAKRLVTLTGKSEKWTHTQLLPQYPKNMYAFEDEHLVRISVSKADYESYRKSKKLIFFHLTHYEAWRYLVYDEKTQKAVIVLEGGI